MSNDLREIQRLYLSQISPFTPNHRYSFRLTFLRPSFCGIINPNYINYLLTSLYNCFQSDSYLISPAYKSLFKQLSIISIIIGN